MGKLTEEQVQIALGRLEPGLKKYLWLQSQVRFCNVKSNAEFQRVFSAFYRVRRDSIWKTQYFDLMESAKANGIEFPEALRELSQRCGTVEASFASKLVATLDPSKPVIDKFVLEYFELQLPRWGSHDRELKTVGLYRELCDKYGALMQSPTGNLIREQFDGRYPNLGVSELKKVDLVLWQIRAVLRKNCVRRLNSSK